MSINATPTLFYPIICNLNFPIHTFLQHKFEDTRDMTTTNTTIPHELWRIRVYVRMLRRYCHRGIGGLR